MRRVGLIAFALVLAGVSRCQAATADSFRYLRTVDRTDSMAEEILSLPLDSDVYAVAQAGLADVRIIDAEGREVPYQLEKAAESRTTTVREPCPSRIVSLRELDDQRLEIVAALAEQSTSASGLVVRSPLRDFERRVQVFGSDHGREWQELAKDAVIFDYSRYMDISNRDIALPANSFRHYRLVIDAISDEEKFPLTELTRHLQAGTELDRTEQTTLRARSLRIDGIDFYRLATRAETAKDVKRAYPVVEFRAEDDAKNKQTTIHVRTRREPVTSFVIETTTANFVRQAAVWAPVEHRGRSEWREVGGATISAIHFQGFERRNLSIAFPEQRQEEYRIIVHNADNPPLTISGVSGEGNVYQVKFIAEKDAVYSLYYGSASAEKPTYDTAALMAALGGRYRSRTGTLGPAESNPLFRATADRGLFDSRLFFGVAIALMVAVLAVVVFGAVRKVDRLPTDR